MGEVTGEEVTATERGEFEQQLKEQLMEAITEPKADHLWTGGLDAESCEVCDKAPEAHVEAMTEWVARHGD